MPAVSHAVPAANVCWVLREDPELAEAIEPERRAQAVEALVAREVKVPTGAWTGRAIPIDDGIGLLVLEGVMLQRVGIDGRFGAELVGEGDVLRAVSQDVENPTLPLTVEWLILEPSRVAVLDERFVRQLARFPQVAGQAVRPLGAALAPARGEHGDRPPGPRRRTPAPAASGSSPAAGAACAPTASWSRCASPTRCWPISWRLAGPR